MNNVFSQIQEKFGVQEVPEGMFYAFEFALRFDLGGEDFDSDRPLLRFARAFERADAIAQSVLCNASEIILLLSTYGVEKPEKARLKPLKSCGMKRSAFEHVWKTAQQDTDHIAECGYDLFRHWDIARLKNKPSVPEILWLSVARDLRIKPALGRYSSAYLVDIANGLIVHAYDYRGMDVVALRKSSLSPLFSSHHDWLLDYDLARMEKTFGQDTDPSRKTKRT